MARRTFAGGSATKVPYPDVLQVVDIDPEEQVLTVSLVEEDGVTATKQQLVRYDVVSFDIGSRTAHSETPGVLQYAICTRPIHQLVAGIDHALSSLEGSEVDVVVVGAGAAGIEIAFTVAVKCENHGKIAHTTLIDSQPELLAGADIGTNAEPICRGHRDAAGYHGFRAYMPRCESNP